MRSIFLIFFVATWGCLAALSIAGKESKNTLRLVHTVFRHGGRNPDAGSVIPGSPYDDESFYPEGYGQLTDAGKLTEYNIGRILRKRYNDFLPTIWNVNYLDVRSTDYNRTKMSVQLMLAGLYPPRGDQVWSSLKWQPIPYNYLRTSLDKETQPWTACGSRWMSLLTEILSSPEIVEYLTRYEELFNILGEKTGSSVGLFSAFSYYFGFAVQRELGYKLEDWTKAIFPEPIHSAAVDFYYTTTNNTAIRRLMSGYLLRKILADTKSIIDGTISPSDRKMFIYSGHELNVGSMVLSLEAYKLADIPAYGAFVLFEIHEIDEVWGIKLFYQNYEQADPLPIKLPGCDYFCPYDDFYNLVEELLPTDDTDCYGS